MGEETRRALARNCGEVFDPCYTSISGNIIDVSRVESYLRGAILRPEVKG